MKGRCFPCGRPRHFAKTSTHLSPRPCFICDVDIDWNYDLDAQTESESDLMKSYNRLGISEHDLNDEINSDVNDINIHGPTVASSPAGDSPEEGPVCVKGRLRDHLSFWLGIYANRCVTLIIRDGYALLFEDLPPAKEMENHKLAWNEKQLVAEQTEELILSCCI